MEITKTTQALNKLAQMGDTTQFERAGDAPQREKRAPYQSRSLAECITHLQTPRGAKPVLKAMMTTACERNCYYCPFRAGRGKTERVTYSPDAMAGAFHTIQHKGLVDGLFLSSGIIKGSVTTQDKIIDTIEIIRRKYQYRGYIHLKIMPGVERDQLHRAMQLADRISVNLEAPTPQRLNALAPKKDFTNELLQMIQWAQELRQHHPDQKLARTVTQFVVGAVGDTDVELLTLSQQLYQHLGLARAYYSAFHPISQTPFEDLAPTRAIREYRLYQSSFLLRDYGWCAEELPFDEAGYLRTDIDPKRAWAEANLIHAPIDLMRADREQLLRIPQIGPKSADAILRARRHRRLTDISQLRHLGIKAPEKAAPFILLDGRRPPYQRTLF